MSDPLHLDPGPGRYLLVITDDGERAYGRITGDTIAGPGVIALVPGLAVAIDEWWEAGEASKRKAIAEFEEEGDD